MANRRLNRRDVLRVVPAVMASAVLAGMGRVIAACADTSPDLTNRKPVSGSGTTPTDGDEYVPPEQGATPTNAGETPPTVPNETWEKRVRQLEDDQQRLYGPVFTKEAPGIMVGKDRSHVPVVTNSVEGGLKRVTVLVQHVMDKNGLDAGYVDAGDAGDAKDAADADAAPDAADAGLDASDAGAGAVDAGKPGIHYITTVFLRADIAGKSTVVGLWEFNSTDPAPPTVKFTLPEGVTSVEAYEWCTLHGLWKASPLGV
jgi:desulfoferrodoxin (superoxide reductase-like protein)